MSSLIASASPWNNDNNTDSGTRKRIPTMRKTVKIRPYAQDVLSQADVSETIESMYDFMAVDKFSEVSPRLKTITAKPPPPAPQRDWPTHNGYKYSNNFLMC
jgi:hypothetical protein